MVRFDPADPLHQEYVTALADLRAAVYRVPTMTLSAAQLAATLATVSVPAFRYDLFYSEFYLFTFCNSTMYITDYIYLY